MAFFDKTEKGSAKPPLVEIQDGKRTRLRIIPLVGTKYEEPPLIWMHQPPRNLQNLFGGYCVVRCIGQRDGCIFHGGDYDWSVRGEGTMSSKIPINVIEYELDSRSGMPIPGNKEIRIWQIGVKLRDQIKTHMGMDGLTNPSERDIMVHRVGENQQTTYTIKFAHDCVDPIIDWSEFAPINPRFADDTYPMLIDFEKINGFIPMTPEEQSAWLLERIKMGEQTQTQAAKKASENQPIWGQVQPVQGWAAPPLHTMGFITPLTSAPNVYPAYQGAPPPMSNLPPSGAYVDYAALESHPNPWNTGTMGQQTPAQLEYIVQTPGFPDQFKHIAAQLLNKPQAAAVPPPMAATPPPLTAAPPPMQAAPPPYQAAAPAAHSGLPPAAPSLPPLGGSSTPQHGLGGLPGASLPPQSPSLPPQHAQVAPPPQVNPLVLAASEAVQRNPLFNDHRLVGLLLSKYGGRSFNELTDESLQNVVTLVTAYPEATIRQFIGA